MDEQVPLIVKRHKYERLNQNTKIWWDNKFKELEDNARIPPHKKLWVLKTLFSSPELKHLAASGVKFDDNEGETRSFKRRQGFRQSTFYSTVYIPSRKESSHKKGDTFFRRFNEFFTKPEDEVRNIWLAKEKPISDSSIPLIRKAAIVEEMLAEKFVNWYKNLHSIRPSEINKEIILNIFETSTSLPIKRSVVVNMKTVEKVPSHVAKYLGDNELSCSMAIKRQISMDQKKSKIGISNKAFNETSALYRRKIKQSTDSLHTRFPAAIKHNELETFEAVFKDIMHLETSKRFVKWLRNNPHIEPPPYLQKTCMTTNLDMNAKKMRRAVPASKIFFSGNKRVSFQRKSLSHSSRSSDNETTTSTVKYIV